MGSGCGCEREREHARVKWKGWLAGGQQLTTTGSWMTQAKVQVGPWVCCWRPGHAHLFVQGRLGELCCAYDTPEARAGGFQVRWLQVRGVSSAPAFNQRPHFLLPQHRVLGPDSTTETANQMQPHRSSAFTPSGVLLWLTLALQIRAAYSSTHARTALMRCPNGM